MRNPWLAIDAATEPAQRARELRRLGAVHRRRPPGARSRADRGLLAALAGPPAWTRPPSGSAPLVADDDEAAARWEVHPLVTSAPLIRECMAGIADDAAHLMVICDADGTLLWLEGAPRVRLAAANSMNFAVGALWSEGRRGHERDRHRARRRPRRAGVRRRALQRGRAAVDLRGRAGARPGDRRRARHRRPHEPHEHRAPALVRGRRRHGGRGRGAPARVDARARPADALALPRPRRGGPATRARS